MEDVSGERNVIRIEEMSLNAWPAIHVQLYAGCILRFSDGYTKRSNSVNALYHDGDIDDLIHYAQIAYTRNKLPTIFKMIDHPKYRALDVALESLGYEKIDQTTVKTIELAERSFRLHEEVRTDDHFSADWIDGFIACNRLESKRKTVEAILNGIKVETIVASVILERKLVGFGFGAVEEEHVGFFDIFLHQDYRGRGYGRKIMESILYRAKARGAQFGYLQVMDNNYPANRLYENLGFKPFYKYWYRRRNLAEGVWGSQSR